MTWGSYLTCNVTLKLRIETNIKLNLQTMEGLPLIDTNSKDGNGHEADSTEVHLMQFEAVTDRFNLKFPSIIKEMWHSRMKAHLEFQDWTLVDFDNNLSGNPHCQRIRENDQGDND